MAASADKESKGNVLDHFSEVNEVCSLIHNLPRILRNFRDLEASQERLTVIVDKYQEQPHLLDPHLDLIITKLFSLVRQEDAPPILLHHAFKYIYLFSKTRGPKVIIRWFSHEVVDLETVLELLQQQDINDFATWETRYVLLLWLSIIVIIPFDLSRLDTSHTHMLMMDRLLNIGKLYLNVFDKSQDAAVLLCSKFLSRPDVQKSKMKEFIDWSRLILQSKASTAKSIAAHLNLQCGILKTLSNLFKIGKREDLLPLAPNVLELINECGFIDSDKMLLRKLYIKLTQRLGTTFLQARLLSWRYQRGSRSLEMTLKGAVVEEPKELLVKEEAEFDVPEEIEEILGTLLMGLKDKDTVVRWSSAKGIGRITGRLPLQLANEVLESLLDCFSSRDSDEAWHGGCLALAELGRRGLLLPQSLPEVLPIILKALIYDEKKGSYSVGSHVRDAACYVCWSFARAYDPEQLKPFIESIAKGLVTVMILDREVNCRRAASAAFQENVGRQGSLPHGIEILTMADYYAVGNISHVYLTLSVQVGHYLEYTRTLIDHLVQHKLGHWDGSLRELASHSLHNMTSLDPQYMKDNILPEVVSQVNCSDQYLRHGSVCAAGELFSALSKIAQDSNHSIEDYFGNELLQSLLGVAGILVTGNLFKGISGDIMRPAALNYIKKCSPTLPAGEDIVNLWQSIIDDNLSHTVDSIRDTAVSSFAALCKYKYCTTAAGITQVQNVLIPRYLDNLQHKNHFTRMGFSLALGALPKELLEGKLDEILHHLLKLASTIQNVSAVYTESRRDAIVAIKQICETVGVATEPAGVSTHVLTEELIDNIFLALFIAIGDYTIDSRGDIGTIVREATMNTLECLCIKLNSYPSLIKHKHIEKTVGHLLQQCNEKIDRTRSLACTKLISLLYHQPNICGITDHDKLLEIFNSDVISDINWNVARKTFPLTVQTLGLPSYSYRTLLGLITSVGGLTESIVQSSSSCLLNYMKSVIKCEDKLTHFTDDILAILDNYPKDSRVVVPMLKVLELLLYNSTFDLYLQNNSSFPSLLLEKLKFEMKGCRDPVKLLASVTVFCGLLQFGGIKKSSLNQIMIYLGHSFPKVRRTTADQLYTTIISFDDLFTVDIAEQVMSILSETTWDGQISSVREQRNIICNLLDLPPLKSKEGSKAHTAKKDEMDYKDLVDRMGY